MKKTKSDNSSANKETLLNELKKLKAEHRRALHVIKEEIRKSDQFRISKEGLENLSKNSINSIQNKREKSILKAKKTFNELIIDTKRLKKIEDRIKSAEK